MNPEDNRFLKLIEQSIRTHWELPALTDHQGDTFYYKDVAKEIARLHLYLEIAGIGKGDKVALIGRNSSRWAITFFGVLSYGAVVVPILHDFKADNVHHIVNHSESKLLLAASQNRQYLNVEEMPGVKLFLGLNEWTVWHTNDESLLQISEQVEKLFQQRYPGDFKQDYIRFHKEEPEELAVLNYTSGTTGFSKGVMIPYRSLWSNTQYAADQLPFVHSGDNFVSMLPMAHMYGLAFEILNGIHKGCHIHFLPRIPNPKSVVESFAAFRPTLIIAVPLILEKIVKNNIFPVLRKPPVNILYKLPGVKQLIKKKILSQLNAAFGNNFEELVIGGAAINKEIEAFLRSLGFRYTVGYGMTECGPLISYEQWDTYKAESVGRVVDRMEVVIDSSDPANEVGEIIVRGMNNMLGYYKNPAATAEIMLPDGWMRTGDLGTIDKDGFLFIRGRCKTMILSSNGQNIYPEEIECVLNDMPYVIESLLVTRKEKIVALIYPDWELAKKNELSDEAVQALMDEHLNVLNQRIPAYAKVTGAELQREAFEKTPKLSIKRYLYQQE